MAIVVTLSICAIAYIVYVASEPRYVVSWPLIAYPLSVKAAFVLLAPSAGDYWSAVTGGNAQAATPVGPNADAVPDEIAVENPATDPRPTVPSV